MRALKCCAAFLIASAGGVLIEHKAGLRPSLAVRRSGKTAAGKSSKAVRAARAARSAAYIGRALRRATKHIEADADRYVAARDLLSREAAYLRATDPFGATLLDGFVQVPPLTPMLMLEPSPYLYSAPEDYAYAFTSEDPVSENDIRPWEDNQEVLGDPAEETMDSVSSEIVESVTRTDAEGNVIHSVRKCKDNRCVVMEDLADSVDEGNHLSLSADTLPEPDDEVASLLRDTSREFANVLKDGMDGLDIVVPLTGNQTQDMQTLSPSLEAIKDGLAAAGLGNLTPMIEGILSQNQSAIQEGVLSASHSIQDLLSDAGLNGMGDLMGAIMEGNETAAQQMAPAVIGQIMQSIFGAKNMSQGPTDTVAENSTKQSSSLPQDMAEIMKGLFAPMLGDGGLPLAAAASNLAAQQENDVPFFLPAPVSALLKGLLANGNATSPSGANVSAGNAPWDGLVKGLASLALPGMLGANGKNTNSAFVEESVRFENGKMVKFRRTCQAGKGCEEETSEADAPKPGVVSVTSNVATPEA